MRLPRLLILLPCLLWSGCEKESLAPVDEAAFVEALNEGVGLMGRFEFDEAGDSFARAVEMRPDSLVARLDEGISILNRSDDDSQIIALERFRALLVEHPLDPRINYCSALALQYLGRPAEAMTHLEVVLEHWRSRPPCCTKYAPGRGSPRGARTKSDSDHSRGGL